MFLKGPILIWLLKTTSAKKIAFTETEYFYQAGSRYLEWL